MEMKVRKSLCASSLLNLVHSVFSKIPDTRSFIQRKSIPLKDHLMSGLAIFGLKFPSLLQYDRNRNNLAIEENLKNLYRVNEPPSDTYLRERLDEVDPKYLRPHEVPYLLGNSRKAKKQLGWHPQVSLEGLAQTMYDFDLKEVQKNV